MNNAVKKIKKVALILAGGRSNMLWPRSTETSPKQFAHLVGYGTMLNNTISRLRPVFDPGDIYIITNEIYLDNLLDQCPEIKECNILLEPFERHTAACMALAYSRLKSQYDDDTIFMAFPSDHFITNVREFYDSLEVAAEVAYANHAIVTLGIKPERPETAFGYVQISENTNSIDEQYRHKVRYTTTFAEKPDLATAKRFLDSGDFLWNSGIFVIRMDSFWESYSKYMPDHARLFKILSNIKDPDLFRATLYEVYGQIVPMSLDYAILEKADNVFVVESSFGWSDVANWDEVHLLSQKDARDNVIEGNVVAVDTRNCLILGSEDKFIGVAGIKDLIIIETDKSLLICPREKSENVRDIVDYLKRKQAKKFI